MSPALVEAIDLLSGLRVGDPVVVKTDGGEQHVTVQRELHRRDGGGFGSTEHSAVIVGFGPGRWNTDISPARIVAGYSNLRRDTTPKG